MSHYLCYDLKGIQQYIFQVPKLKCCIGGSRMVDDFDRITVVDMEKQHPDCRKIYSGGGKGAFSGEKDKLDELKKDLVRCAMARGLTIRFGESEDYSTGATEITETFCYQPDSLDGQPCELSGMYPTTEGIHKVFKDRNQKGSDHGEESMTENKFLSEIRGRVHEAESASFFYDVAADSREGKNAAFALGNRNRWAVVCMDGNDMGEQFRQFKKQHQNSNDADAVWGAWLGKMSPALDDCTCRAAQEAMIEVVKQYGQEEGKDGFEIIPIRPLIIGGDDITLLIHCNYASLFVKTAIEKFNEFSKEYRELWVGTGGELTISAGILYAPVTLPLNMAIGYAEMLLASAKTRGRDEKKKNGGSVSEPCVDWESVTEGFLTEPHIRRRELKFKDEEIGREVVLTKRPYTLKEFIELEDKFKYLQKVPWSILHELKTSLCASKPERLAFYAKLGKNWPEIAKDLQEPLPDSDGKYGEAWNDKPTKQLQTDLLDRILLLEEEKRMQNPTVSNEEED